MLTEKDYCDYETCVALKELGYKVPTSAYYMPNNNQLIFVSNPCRGGYVIDCFYSHNSFPKNVMTSNYIDAPTIWEAQKWLREEKGIHISIDYDEFDWSYCLFDCSKKHYKQLSNCRMYFKSYEEALLNGIKVSVEFLKEK